MAGQPNKPQRVYDHGLSIAELDKRAREDEANPGAAIPWEVVRSRVRGK